MLGSSHAVVAFCRKETAYYALHDRIIYMEWEVHHTPLPFLQADFTLCEPGLWEFGGTDRLVIAHLEYGGFMFLWLDTQGGDGLG